MAGVGQTNQTEMGGLLDILAPRAIIGTMQRWSVNRFGKGFPLWAFAWLIALPGAASEYSEAWGPPTGSAMPAIAALDQAGETRHLAGLASEGGLLFLVVRSADW